MSAADRFDGAREVPSVTSNRSAPPGEIIERPIYGQPTMREFGQVVAMLQIDSREQIQLLRRVLHDGLVKYAGRVEETFLAKLDRDLADIERRADRERWAGWSTDAGRAALQEVQR